MPSLSVLLIEDDEHDATLILDALRHAGYELVAERVATADGLRAGLARQTWDLITCDETLPGWSALAALALIRAHDSNVPIVVVSGRIGEEVAAALIRAGADDLVLKHNVRRLAKAVEQALRDATNRRRLPGAQAATDGTARKTTEPALHESEQLFRTLVEHAADAIYVHDVFGIITEVNPCACESLGYSRDELIGRPLTDIDLHLDADRVRHFLPQLLSGAPVLIETVHRRKDGTTFPVEIRAVRITRNGRPHVLGTCRDVTERKEAERALRASEERFALAVRGSDAGIWDWDLRTRELYFSSRWKEMLGLPEAATGELWRPRIHPDDVEKLAAAIEPILNGASDSFECEHRLLHADGSYRWILARGIALRDPTGKPYRMTGSQTDITDRKQAEEALRATRAALEVAVTAAGVGLGNWDLRTGEVHYSDSWRALFGYSPADFEDQLEAWTANVHPEDLGRVLREMQAAVEDPSVPNEQEFRLRRQDGTYCWVLRRGTVLRDAAGHPCRSIAAHVDIAKRKQAEEALREARATLEVAVMAARAGLWDWDLQTGETHYTDSWRTLFGYAAADLDGSLQEWATLVHPDDIERLTRNACAAIEAATSFYEEEFRLRHKDGTYRWVLSRATVLRDAGGTPQRMLGAHVDITKHKQAEDAARRSARQVQALFEASVDVIGIMEVDGTFRDVSPSIRTLLGYEVSELVGRNGFDFVHRDDRAALQAALARRIALTGDRTSEGCRLQRADGSWVYVESTLSNLLDDPDVRGLMTITRDVTERARLYAELAALNHELEARVAERTRQLTEAQERLSLVIDIASDGFWDWNLTTGKVYYSPRWIELLGYDPHEVRHHTSFAKSLVHPEDMPRVQHALRDHFEGRTSIYECQNRLRMHSGRYRWNLSRGRVVERDADGRPLRMVGVDVDLSEKKVLEEQLLHAQKMEAVGQLAGGVAHDFNNQLFVIRGYCDLLLKHAAAQPPLLGPLEQIKHAVQRSAALTTQLLAFSRKQVLQPKVLNLNAELFGIEKMLRRLIGEDVQLTLIPGADVGRLKADPLQLQQIVMNLAINARDAMPHGGMLTLETKNAEIDAAYAHSHFEVRPGPYVALAVSDTGHGMDRETLARVFEPFFTTKEPGKGTGLGLATVHGIVKQSGGHIAVDSEPGRGTTFTIYLPRVDEAVEPAHRGAPEQLAGGSETILLVEDEPAVCEVVRRVLAAQGYHVLLATNGKHGLELAERFDGPIHLLLTDVVMPEMNGPQLAARLQAVRPETAVIYMSGYAENAIAHHGVLEAGLAFLPKPCPTNLLVRTVRERLDARARR